MFRKALLLILAFLLPSTIIVNTYIGAQLGSSFIKTAKASTNKTLTNPGDSIQEAINAASPGYTVLVPSGTYHEHLVINKSLMLKGAGSNKTFIDGSGEDKIIITIIASNVEISGFTIQNGTKSLGYQYGGIQTMNIVNATIRNNVMRKSYFGIFLSASNSCNVIDNIIIDNYYGGVKVSDSSNNKIVGNTISNNTLGIWITSEKSQSNSIYHNNFINNTDPAPLPRGKATKWDNGAEGNYWSDYTGVDLCHGTHQNETGSDGIGDTPYPDEWGWDNYPLMAPINRFNAGTWNEVTYYVNTVSNSMVSIFDFDPDAELISFNVNGTDGTVGFCRVTIPKTLMWCGDLAEWNVTVNGNQPTYLKAMEDADNTYLYFTYNHSIQNVKIKGVYVIPEFPTTQLLPIVMFIILLTTILVKRRNRIGHSRRFRDKHYSYARVRAYLQSIIETF